MRAARPRTELFAIGMALDRAVHQTFAQFWIVVPPFVIADALGSILAIGESGVIGTAAALLGGMILENRARVMLIASLAQAKPDRIAWRAAIGHFPALAFAVISLADIAVPYLTAILVLTPFALVNVLRTLGAGVGIAAAYAGGVTLALTLTAVLLVALLLVILACAAATVDVVLERKPLVRAIGGWLRRTFRRRALGSTVLAAATFALLVAGTPFLLSFVPEWGLRPARLEVDAIPEGIADAIAMLFAWRWRDAILEQREGRDLDALLARITP